jgi:hypothetical protein
MDPAWHKIRLIATLVASGIGGVLLVAAGFVADSVSRVALAWMVVLGLVIPFGCWAFVTLAGWHRRPAGFRRPPAAILWANERHRYPLLLAGFVAFLFLGFYQIAVEVQRGGAERAMHQAFEKALRQDLGDACRTRAPQVIDKIRPAIDAALNARVPHFCACLDGEIEHAYTPAEFAAVPKEQWWAAGDAKIDRIVQKCRIDDSSIIRAARTIRATGGNPESQAMEPQILAYTACVKGEVEQGFTGAAQMRASSDPKWQDSDDRFRQIIARCMKNAGW